MSLSDVYGSLLVVAREVIYTRFVGWGIILLADILLYGYLLWCVLLVVMAVGVLLQYDILLYLALNTLFELHRGEFQKFYHLDLLWRYSRLQRYCLLKTVCHTLLK